MGCEVHKKLVPVNCPRKARVNVVHHANEASRLYNGNIDGSTYCPILKGIAHFYVHLQYDNIVGLHCNSVCSRCLKSGTTAEDVTENTDTSFGFDVTAEFAKVASKKPSNI
jgi:hypothetical protein